MAYELIGTVSHIIYQSADGYAVIEVEGEEPTIVVGSLPDIKVGERARFFGAYKTHARYGNQFAATSYESTLPDDVNDMAAFLGGGFIKGLGEVLALRIVEEFGDRTFDVIEHDYAELTRVKGVSRRLAESVHAAFLEYATQKFTYTRLMGMGLTARQATECVNEFGQDAADLIRENPYVLAQRIYGIDFITADRIAHSLGIEMNDPLRVKQGILHVLHKMMANGHLYIRRERLTPHVAEKLGVAVAEAERALLLLALEGQVVLRKYYPDLSAVFLKQAYDAEAKCAVKLFELAQAQIDEAESRLEKLLNRQRMALDLTEEQCAAVRMAAQQGVCIITGGPGTGKTTILRALLGVLGGLGRVCSLSAPTGRAAKRMNETTGQEAQTLHRLLEYSYDEDAYQCFFRRNGENPLDADVVIVDEVSMIDIFLFRKLLVALKEGARLVLVGDADQLPSVGPGNVMGDIIASGVIPTVRLTHRFRNAGSIADAAYDVLEGTMPAFDDDFAFHSCATDAETARFIKEAYEACYTAGEDVQVIAPVKLGQAGTKALDLAIRDRVNPAANGKSEMMYGDKVFREGDRVMQIKNNYAKQWHNYENLTQGEGVFNGDIGRVSDISAGRLNVLFEDMKCSGYDTPELGELDGAFAYTIHKSQGSEFDVILLPLQQEATPFFARNLLYTGITRAKTRVVLAGSRRTLEYMIGNYRPSIRATVLCRELKYLQRLAGHTGDADLEESWG